jgi:hypothetical protein
MNDDRWEAQDQFKVDSRARLRIVEKGWKIEGLF